MGRDVLAEICARKRQHIAERKAARPPSELEARARAALPPRGFARRLAEAVEREGLGLIAEIKHASPSRGLIREDFDPAWLARSYARGGAACLSVLTDEHYFRGSDEHLRAARAACELPVLRKDFMLDPYQVAEARALGADGILLIVAALDEATARALMAEARLYRMDVLVEVHDELDLEHALMLDATLIGINNRDLRTLDVDLATTERLAPRVPPDLDVARS
ncbi:MAG TPA: indole-3-glycerol phosphate synthase TrpC, partial [Alphaproteobacteria bacterium]|nr:indole-3-glycerol phosphate synthase TrpC [Alphaproteobacteria bacterium]